MEFTEVQICRIKALSVLGVPLKMIKQRFDCEFSEVKQALKDYPLTEMTEKQAIEFLLDT